jgi:signal transduction histidine kinase
VCEPVGIVRAVVLLMRVRAAAQPVQLELALDPSVPATLVSDATRVQQILAALLDNAIRVTPAGGRVLVTVWAERDVTAAGGQRLLVSVRDGGPCLSEQQVAELLRPHSLSGADGISLASEKHLAVLLGGDISVRRVPDSGSVFTLSVACDALGFRHEDDAGVE